MQCSHLFFTELCTFIPLVCCCIRLAPSGLGLLSNVLPKRLGIQLVEGEAARKALPARHPMEPLEAIVRRKEAMAAVVGLFRFPE